MKIPGYPSNREADERTQSHCSSAGRRPIRMKLSRETCLCMKYTPGVEWSYRARRQHAIFPLLPLLKERSIFYLSASLLSDWQKKNGSLMICYPLNSIHLRNP